MEDVGRNSTNISDNDLLVHFYITGIKGGGKIQKVKLYKCQIKLFSLNWSFCVFINTDNNYLAVPLLYFDINDVYLFMFKVELEINFFVQLSTVIHIYNHTNDLAFLAAMSSSRSYVFTFFCPLNRPKTYFFFLQNEAIEL
jgi:hypothetical protein